jgi:hypothetical protein
MPLNVPGLLNLPQSGGDVPALDPKTGAPWTRFFDTQMVVRYLRSQGIKVAAQTLAHRRSEGRGIKWSYAGQRPLTTKEEVDRYIAEELLQPASPLAGRAGRKGGGAS